jgi:hypothetical protein
VQQIAFTRVINVLFADVTKQYNVVAKSKRSNTIALAWFCNINSGIRK